MTSTTSRIVSSEDESLILVDADDRQTGRLDKAECHNGDGILHRAFSIFLFDDQGNLLLQKRARGKRLWPGYWSNSCCSHPRDGETLDVAVERRLEDELHTGSDLQFVYKFIYQANFGDIGAENELCHVFLGRVTGEPSANDMEIEAVRYLSAAELEREFEASPDAFTPWFKMEWQRLKEAHGELLATYTKAG
ncbi:MAG: isopentenyl-diphosphate Delta-isomerase [Woeseiaceae bacterium]|nr:isopentenyl-diphosphate Delta-isomerase [Woeseiaceae bacterium]